MPSTTLRTVTAKRAHAPSQSVRPARIDTLREAAGTSWRTVGASRKRIALALDLHPSNVSRRTTGNESTALSRAAEEAYREARGLELARIEAACMVETRLKVARVYPTYERMTLPELEAELRRVLKSETPADAACDVTQTDILHDGIPADLTDAIVAAHTHANRLARSIALMELIQERRRTGRAS